MTPQAIDGVGGSSKGHNSSKNVIFDDKYVDKNVVLDVIPDNMCEVASFNKSSNAYFSNLTPDPSGSTEGTGYYNVYQGDGSCYNSCVDMCTYNTGNLIDIYPDVSKRHSAGPQGTTYSVVHHTDHYVAPQMEPHPAIPLITDSNTSKPVHQLACHLVTLFDAGFYNAINNSDTWYCYIHGYPCGSPGGFYLIEIS